MKGTPWVLVTMDSSIVDDHRGFDWSRYAIAWVQIDSQLRGIRVEHSKNEVLAKHARTMLSQIPGDHFTYTETRRYKHPPSLVTQNRRARHRL